MTKKILIVIIAAPVVFGLSMAVHRLFLNLDQELLRSAILGVGASAMAWVVQFKQKKRRI